MMAFAVKRNRQSEKIGFEFPVLCLLHGRNFRLPITSIPNPSRPDSILNAEMDILMGMSNFEMNFPVKIRILGFLFLSSIDWFHSSSAD
jgi:hypothetical protein